MCFTPIDGNGYNDNKIADKRGKIDSAMDVFIGVGGGLEGAYSGGCYFFYLNLSKCGGEGP